MKRLFKIFTIVFSFAVVILLGAQVTNAQQIESDEIIQNIKNKSEILVLNNLLGEQITSHRPENQLNFSGGSHVGSAINGNTKLLTAQEQQLLGCLGYGSSLNFKKVQQIKAP